MTQTFLPPRHTVLRWAAFFAYSLFLLMWLSPDSFLAHVCAYHEDSSWFFTAGKAWMEGLTPYVDFADSKGPLLWLIYGTGYLLSPTSFIGVFWLSVLAYTVTLDFIWRTVRLFVGRRESALVLAIMPILLFIKLFHNEVRAEDFCMPWLCIGIYCTCRTLTSPRDTSVRKYAFWLGIGMAWCLLIKWNFFVLMGCMALIIISVSFSRKRIDALLFGLLGIAILTLPFVAYFLLEGNLTAMVQEYVVNTFLITEREKNAWHTVFFNLLTDRSSLYQGTVLTGIVIGILLFCRRFRISYWLLATYLPFFLFLLFKPTWYYYFAIVMPFYVFFLIYIASICSGFLHKCPKPLFVFIMATVCLGGIAYNVHRENLVFFPSPEQEWWDDIQWVMKKKEKPRIIVEADCGYGLLNRALPACKYWAPQSGANNEMFEERRQAIKARKADFVIVQHRESKEENIVATLRANGYHQCIRPVIVNGRRVMKPLGIYEKE